METCKETLGVRSRTEQRGIRLSFPVGLSHRETEMEVDDTNKAV